MKMAKIRFLEQGEEAKIPMGAKLLPKRGRLAYAEKRRPFRVEEEGDILTGILQTQAEKSMLPIWRENAAGLLRQLQKGGVSIVIPPTAGEIPRTILPLAEGRKLMTLFAFEGAAEALRRQGKEPDTCTYLFAGGDPALWRMALISLGNEVNHLAIFTEDIHGARAVAEELFEERGLVAEVFSSPKNILFPQADVVFCCGFANLPYEHMLKGGCIWFDLVGNRPVLRRLRERQDITLADGFFFRQERSGFRSAEQKEGRIAEAEAFLSSENMRDLWQLSPETEAGAQAFREQKEREWAVSGFSLAGKRVKIRRKP